MEGRKVENGKEFVTAPEGKRKLTRSREENGAESTGGCSGPKEVLTVKGAGSLGAKYDRKNPLTFQRQILSIGTPHRAVITNMT